MTYRELTLRALRRQPHDEVPFVPRWELWFDAAKVDGRLPAQYRDRTIYEVARDLGFGLHGREGRIFRRQYDGVEVESHRAGDTRVTVYHTPVGDLVQEDIDTAELRLQGVRGRTTKHLITNVRDYGPALYLAEHSRLVPTYEDFERYDHYLGDDGVAIAQTGTCPAHRLMREFTGYIEFYYEMNDRPALVERLLAALTEADESMLAIVAESPADLIGHDGNFDSTLMPPPVYRRYFLPFFRRLCDAARSQGKVVVTHDDGRSEALMPLIEESGFDAVEAFTPPPMTGRGVADGRRAWGDRVAIWGGIASNMLPTRIADEEFEAHVRQCMAEAQGFPGFILGLGDNVPTDCSWERILRLRDLAGELGCRIRQGRLRPA
ncbi:MAG: uroporphyrinogen decarboxylase family protein [Anaerolineae bacterium]